VDDSCGLDESDGVLSVIDLQKAWSDGSVMINMEPYPILGTETVVLGNFLASEGREEWFLQVFERIFVCIKPRFKFWKSRRDCGTVES